MGNPLLIYTPVPLASLVCDILKACKYLLFGKDYLEYLASWLGGVLVTEPGTLPPALCPLPPAPSPPREFQVETPSTVSSVAAASCSETPAVAPGAFLGVYLPAAAAAWNQGERQPGFSSRISIGICFEGF